MNNVAYSSLRVGLVLCFAVVSSQAAETPPASKVEILQPGAGLALQGTVEVRVKITPPEGKPMPGQAYAGLGGPPWAKLNREAATDEWIGSLDSTLVPNGKQELRVFTDERRARGLITVSVENPLKCYFGEPPTRRTAVTV